MLKCWHLCLTIFCVFSDIIEDESGKKGVDKAEEFVKQQEANGLQSGPSQPQHRDTDTRCSHTNGIQQAPNQPQHRDTGTRSYSPTRSYTYSPTRARMEADQEEPTNHVQADSSIHVTSKYEDLVRSQLSHTKSSILDTDFDAEINNSVKSDYSDLDGRRSPVGDDGAKQYQVHVHTP